MSLRGAATTLLMSSVFGGCHIPGPAPRSSRPAPTPVARDTPVAPKAVPVTTPVAPALPPTPSLIPPPVEREFRGVWVASVANIDWPSSRSLTTAEQQAELLALLDRAVALKLNAVIFQVRPAADALYASSIEPWSEYLTGAQGRAPNPYWDPLAYVIKEAHARNLELHAWFNPYRARHTDARSPLSASHIARSDPSLVKPYAGYLWMDPGEPAVRARTVRVVLDVVKRYDVDGVHIDDYFYPYPANDRRGRTIEFPDNASWQKYRRGGGTLIRADWRRQNVNSLVKALHDGIHDTKPWVRFGISPFGIWRPGYPAQIRGLDAYTALYADARKWLREGWLDYFTPQLYWATTKMQQSYSALLGWWSDENVHRRHLWPGNFTSRAGAPGASAFPVADLMEQIRITREHTGASGNVHFSMKSFLVNQAGMNDTLLAGPYASVALVPATPWLRAAAPPVPTARIVTRAPSATGATSARPEVRVQFSTSGGTAPWQWVVRLRTETAWRTVLLAGTQSTFTVPAGARASALSVSSLNRVGTESAAVTVSLAARTATDSLPPRGGPHAP